MNTLFQNAINKVPQKTPPIWFMRQAGRYHSHYQKLRAQHSFYDLCKKPKLACEVAMGPIQDFDFDVAILFSDLLFPLEAIGMGLSYSDAGPKLGFALDEDNFKNLKSADLAIQDLYFQGEAMELTRKTLGADKSLIGFVGGLWTLFVYATEGTHAGACTKSKSSVGLRKDFFQLMHGLIEKNIEIQLKSGAEVVMVMDTAAGELMPLQFQKWIEPSLIAWAKKFPNRLGYYAKHVGPHYYSKSMQEAPWGGFGFDHRIDFISELKRVDRKGLLQGNFDQSLLFLQPDDFKKEVDQYFASILELSKEQRAGWVCGLGHGVLPRTPESHVRYFVKRAREVFK